VAGPGGNAEIERLLKSVASASQSLLMLDYDGTLAPFRTQRDRAFPYPGVGPLLQEIVRDRRTRLVIISGRDVTETISLLGIEPCPEVWGLHGLQRRRVGGAVVTARLEERMLDALSDAERWLGYQRLQHVGEFKTGSIAVHWRGLSDWGAEELRGRVLSGWRPIAEGTGLELLEFDGGVEIRVAQMDKGGVVRVLLAEMDPDTPAIYLGDDNTDERAFRAIRGRGLGVLVRTRWRPTLAQAWLKPPDELLAFLRKWLQACRRDESGRAAAAVK